jgi:hypothetical protein
MRRLPLCLLGAVHRLGNHRCIVPLVPGPPQPAVSHLGVARATRLCGLHHSPPVLVGISLLLHRWVAPASPRGSWPIRWFACPGSPSGNACGIQTDCGGTARIPFEPMGVNRSDFLFAYAALPEDALYTDPLPQTSFLHRSSSREPLHRSCQLP